MLGNSEFKRTSRQIVRDVPAHARGYVRKHGAGSDLAAELEAVRRHKSSIPETLKFR
jgi:hypothetical protein